MLVTVQDGNGDPIAICMPGQETVTDHSGTVVAGGTAQNAFEANAARSGWLFTNYDTVAMHLSLTGAATGGAGSIPVPPGATVGTCTGLPNVATAVSVLGATTDAAYTAQEW